MAGIDYEKDHLPLHIVPDQGDEYNPKPLSKDALARRREARQNHPTFKELEVLIQKDTSKDTTIKHHLKDGRWCRVDIFPGSNLIEFRFSPSEKTVNAEGFHSFKKNIEIIQVHFECVTDKNSGKHKLKRRVKQVIKGDISLQAEMNMDNSYDSNRELLAQMAYTRNGDAFWRDQFNDGKTGEKKGLEVVGLPTPHYAETRQLNELIEDISTYFEETQGSHLSEKKSTAPTYWSKRGNQ